MTDKTEGVAAVERALAILNAFRMDDGPLTLHEVAQRTGLYKSTILRVMQSLIRFGCLQQLPDSTYRLGHTVMRWGSVYRGSLRLDDQVVPVLNALVQSTGEGASFFQREGDVRLCLFRVDPRKMVRDHIYAGQVLPLNQGAAGRALMDVPGDPANWSHDRVIVTIGEREPDMAAVAAPVFGPADQVIGAIAVSGPAMRFTPEVLPAFSLAVRDAAIQLTQRLGGRTEFFGAAQTTQA
jgi:DNA-binding IclR family transcriptional regulator